MIIADGKVDNSDAINALIKQGGTIVLPDGVIRCAKPLVSGEINYTIEQYKNLGTIPSQVCKFAKPFNLTSNGRTTIVKDFPDNSLPLICVAGAGRNSDYTSSSLSKLTFRGIGPGIVANYVDDLHLSRLKLFNFTDALVMNNSYFCDISSIQFTDCPRVGTILQSHGGVIKNWRMITCTEGLILGSNGLVFEMFYANYCNHALTIKGGLNTFTTLSLETNRPGTQLIIGNDSGDKIDGLIFNQLMGGFFGKSDVVAIQFNKTAGTIEVHGGDFRSANYVIKEGSTAKILTMNSLNNFPKSLL